MSTAVQLRRGTTAQHAGFTGAVGEVTVDTDKDTVVVHDGATAGGHPLAKDATIGARKASAVAGTVDAITATFSPAFASLAATAGYVLAIPLAGANTSTTPSLAVDGFTAKTIVKGSNVALAPGDIPGADFVGLFVYDASLDKFQLLNPYQATAASATQIFSLTASVAANALTISAGTLSLDFRDTTLGTGTTTQVVGDPADLVISSGSTLGTTSGVKSRIAVLAINNAGTIELAAVNTAGGVDLSETGVITTTAEGGAGAADSISTIYSASARAGVAYRVLGFIESTQATAGTWATAPSKVQGAGGQALESLTGIVLGTPAASTSGTAIDFTNIPFGVKRITVMLTGVSTNGSSPLLVQLGDAGGVETSGYDSVVDYPTNYGGSATTGFRLIYSQAAGEGYHVKLDLCLLDPSTNTWIASVMAMRANTAGATIYGGGVKSLSDVLDRIRITATNGTDAFDAGKINIQYK